MCGIAGIIVKRETQSFDMTSNIQKMTRMIAHRGPDGEGFFYHRNAAFGHRRLAIIDLSEDGHQPMAYDNGRYIITFNGEIYNYIELRQQLKDLGYHFHSHTDTEVILAAFQEWGEDCVQRFNGMWAFAILDTLKNTIFCSRDRFGVKPFYYINTPDIFAFGSEIRQLLPLLSTISVNRELMIDFILTSVTDHNENTWFKNIVKLPASHNLTYSLDTNHIQIRSWYQIAYRSEYADLSPESAVEKYMDLLNDAVKLRLRADVLVGTCLSGGLDSSTVASLAAPFYRESSGQHFYGITAVSEQESNNEAAYAQKVIEHLQMHWLQVKPDYSSFENVLPDVVKTQEEPFGSPSIIMQYLVMQKARAQKIPVLLDGQGGDETLLGYEKYYGTHLATILRREGIRAFKKALQSASMNNHKMSFTNAMKYMVAGTMAPLRYLVYCQRQSWLSKAEYPLHLSDFSKAGWDTFELQKLEVERTNLPVLLRYEDKNSMAHSIETRLPFLDYRVLEAAFSLPDRYKIRDGWSKWLLRKGMEGKMPESIVWRKNKFGFEAPESLWLEKHVSKMEEIVLASPLLQAIAKKDKLSKKYSKMDKRSQWRLYSIALWEKSFGVVS